VAHKRIEKKGIFSDARFLYNPDNDTYRCPAGNLLKPKSLHIHRNSRDYAAPKKVCAVCELREQCTKNKSGRTVKRHLRQQEIVIMRKRSRSAEAKRDLRKRQSMMERSFARATRYDFDRARWRGLWRMRIQELLVCSIQNIQVLIRQTGKPNKAVAARVKGLKNALFASLSRVELCGRRGFGSLYHSSLGFQRT